MAEQPTIVGRQEPYVNTGIGELDAKIGGLPNDSVILLMGELGSGYDLFAQQILYGRANRGERVCYMTVERPPEDVIHEIKSYDLPKPAGIPSEEVDINKLVENRIWGFVNAYETRIKVEKEDLGPKFLTKTLQEFPKTVSAIPGAWSAVDTFSYYLLSLDLKEVLSFADDMTDMARNHGGLHFLLTTKNLHDDTTITRLANLLDGYFEFNLDPSQEEPTGNLRIKKLRRANYYNKMLTYSILKSGLHIETFSRIR